MSKKRIALLFISMLLGAFAIRYYQSKAIEHPENLQSTEPESILPIAESIAPTIEEKEPIEQIAFAPTLEPSITHVSKSISVKNNITDKMLTYKKGFISYIPAFKIVVNGISLAQGEQQSIEIPDQLLKVTYSYDFVNGYKTGTRTVVFNIPENLTEAAITFDWKNDWRVIIDGAKPLEIIE